MELYIATLVNSLDTKAKAVDWTFQISFKKSKFGIVSLFYVSVTSNCIPA